MPDSASKADLTIFFIYFSHPHHSTLYYAEPSKPSSNNLVLAGSIQACKLKIYA